MKRKTNLAKIVLGYYRPEGETAVGLLPLVRTSAAPLGVAFGFFVRTTDPQFQRLLAAGLELVPLYGETAPAPEVAR